MRTASKTLIAAALLLLTLAIFFLMLNRPVPVAPPAPVIEQDTTSINDYVDKVSRERELEQERHYDERKQVKLAAAKKNSVECQFWKQQKPSKKSEEKIAQYCELAQTSPETQNPSAQSPGEKAAQ
jgi:hypothetical protein